jgi:small subunit ribosomal protein S14
MIKLNFKIKFENIDMAKKNMLQRQIKKEKIINKFIERRKDFLNNIRKNKFNQEKFLINNKLQKLPLNSSNIRLRNRCNITGRPRGFFRFFGLSRNIIRNFAHKSLLPGITKSSW